MFKARKTFVKYNLLYSTWYSLLCTPRGLVKFVLAEALQHIGRRYTILIFLVQQHCGITLYFSTQDEGLYTVTASNLCGSISYSVIVRILEDEQEYEWMAYRRSKQIIPRYFTAIVNTETSKIFKFIVQIIEAKTCVLYCNMLSKYYKGQSKSEVVRVGSRCSRK